MTEYIRVLLIGAGALSSINILSQAVVFESFVFVHAMLTIRSYGCITPLHRFAHKGHSSKMFDTSV